MKMRKFCKMTYFLAAFVIILFANQVISHTIIREDNLVISYQGITRSACDSEEYRFQTFLTNKLSDCIIECALREHCEVLNYLQAYKLCELYQINDPVSNITGNCFRIHKEDIRIDESPCTEACKNGTACDRKTKTCQIKECLETPQLLNGRVRGNLRAVGNRIKYECDEGYELKNRSDHIATCLENGNWSTHAYCRKNCSSEPVIWNGNLIQTTGAPTQLQYEVHCYDGYILMNSSNNVIKCLDDGFWDNRGVRCVIDPKIGEECWWNQLNCNHPSVRCLPRSRYNDYCHCEFGYEYNQTLRLCVQVCTQYTTDLTMFTKQDHTYLPGYNLGPDTGVSVNSTDECVKHCTTQYSDYLSFTFSSHRNVCKCKSLSEKQYTDAHGTLVENDNWSFYDRPCISPIQ